MHDITLLLRMGEELERFPSPFARLLRMNFICKNYLFLRSITFFFCLLRVYI